MSCQLIFVDIMYISVFQKDSKKEILPGTISPFHILSCSNFFVTIINSSQAHVSLAVFSLAHSLGGRLGAGVPSVEVSL